MGSEERTSQPFSELEQAEELLSEDPRYRKILHEALPLLAKGRWYDLSHTLIAVKDMSAVLAGERTNGILKDIPEEEYQRYRKILLPSIILHDIGWSSVGPEKNSQWDRADLRVTHMAKGAELAQGILENSGYDPELNPEITALIAHHDDQYLGIDPQTDLEKMHRDVDACFIPTEYSFWKDHAKAQDKIGKDIDPAEYLQSRKDKFGTRYTKSAQAIMTREIEKRQQEIALSPTVSPKMRLDNLQRKACALNVRAVRQ